MKILAIRGANLASLEGEFALELGQEPLAESGLIALTGPTGAGKSTLLDAMCLALFDRTPRLKGRGGNRIEYLVESDREVLSSDPRTLLRRGTAEGWAEVDFRGKGGRRWRATWSVRRARGRVDGRLQPQTMRLLDLDHDQAAGSGTKKSVLKAIEAALGLDYEAFCRSVLLAQGDFQSFLRARPEERAALLERLTGSAIYGELSRAAHRRAAAQARLLESLDLELAALRPLSDEERERHQTAEQTASAQREQARRQAAAARGAIAWHEGQERLTRKLSEAQLELERAEAEWKDSAPLRESLSEGEWIQARRALFEAAVRASRAAAEAAQARQAATTALETAQAELQQAQAAAEAAEKAAEEAELAQRRKAPELAQARQAEAQLGERQQALTALRARLEQAEVRWQTASHEVDGAQAELEALRAQRARLQERLAADPALVRLVEGWARWEPLLDELVQACQALAQRGGERRELAERLEDRTAVLRALSERERELGQVLAQAQAEETAARERLPREWRETRAALEAGRLALSRAAEAADQARAAAAEADAQRTAAAEQEAAAEAAERQLGALVTAIPAAEAALEEARRALAACERTLGLEAERRSLSAGQPCPLCGACEHPYAHELPPLEALWAEHSERVDEQARALAALRVEQSDVRQRWAQSTERARAARKAARKADQTEGQAQRAWNETLERLDADDLPTRAAEPEAPTAVDARRRRLEARLAELAEQDLALEQARAQQSATQARWDKARAARERAEAARAEARDLLAEHDSWRVRLESRREELLDALTAVYGEVAPPVQTSLFESGLRPALTCDQPEPSKPSWRQALLADPAASLAETRAAVIALRELKASLASTTAQVDELSARLGTLAARREERAAQRDALAAERATLAAATAEAEEVCTRLLGGRTASAVAEELGHREQTARAAFEGARQRRERAERGLASAQAADQATADRGRAAQLEDEERAAELEAVLADAPGGLAAELADPHRRELLLARSPEWLETTRAELAALEERGRRARQTLEILRAQRDEHAARAPEGDPAAAEPPEDEPDPARWWRTSLAAAEAAATAAEEALVAARAALAADRQALGQAEALRPQRAEQAERAELSRRLADLIGAHDGKKLRVFAQGLTLELLLERANRHLTALAPRYRLRRVAEQDLELEVVDRDLGDEVRGLASLSGGEGFLVSLALALGLSALAAGETPIESLFVDEGFGSLDPTAQELALTTLDTLQAEGRQITLISHLPELAERLGVVVRVQPLEPGRSELRLLEAVGA